MNQKQIDALLNLVDAFSEAVQEANPGHIIPVRLAVRALRIAFAESEPIPTPEDVRGILAEPEPPKAEEPVVSPEAPRADPVKEAVIKNRNAIQKAYERHYVSRQHEKPPCGACHFYQGGYAALSEILGESGLLPKRPESAEKPLHPKPIFPNSVVPAVGNTGLLPANVAEECQCGTTPDHDPPNMIRLDPGDYCWTCPGCGVKQYFTVPEVTF